MAISKTLTIIEFLKLVGTVRMCYGQQAATQLFENSIVDFTGLSPQDFKALLTPQKASDNVELPRDKEPL